MSEARSPHASGGSPDYEVRVVGAPRTPLRDFYHALMRLSWPETLGVIATGYLAANALFACGYLAIGGIAHASPGSFAHAFYFSVQTMGTIGYGAMYPESGAANVLVVVESMVGLLLTALSTGLVFSKFSIPTARVMFSRCATIAPMNGVPTLAFRIGNQRKNKIVEAQIRVAMVRTEQTSEGGTFYRMLDLKLLRDRVLSLQRSWIVLHPIDAASPLHGETPDSLAEQDVELLVSVGGTDDIWMQSVHASHRYFHDQIVWGGRLADVLSESDNVITLDLGKFHEVVAVDPELKAARQVSGT